MPSGQQLSWLREWLASLDGMELRRARQQLEPRFRQELGLSWEESLPVLEIGRAVAREGTDRDFDQFLRTGKLPILLPLTPRQMEHVRGGMLQLTSSQGEVPWALFELVESGDDQ